MGHVAGPVIWSFLWQFIYFIFACPMYDPLMMRQAAVRWMPPLVLPIGVAKPSCKYTRSKHDFARSKFEGFFARLPL